MQGIEYINEYLRRLLIENRFCLQFDPNRVILLLKSHCPDYKELLINIYEPIAVNAIGLSILDRDIHVLDISGKDRDELIMRFKVWTKDKTIGELQACAGKLSRALNLEDDPSKEYLQKTAAGLYPRIEAALQTCCLDGIFHDLYGEQEEEVPEIRFIDGEMLDDESLRKLIDEIRCCRFTSDKIAAVKREIHSIKDLTEVLGDCFRGDECTALFDTFGNPELAILLRFVRSQQPGWQSDSGWELKLTDYVNHRLPHIHT